MTNDIEQCLQNEIDISFSVCSTVVTARISYFVKKKGFVPDTAMYLQYVKHKNFRWLLGFYSFSVWVIDHLIVNLNNNNNSNKKTTNSNKY